MLVQSALDFAAHASPPEKTNNYCMRRAGRLLKMASDVVRDGVFGKH